MEFRILGPLAVIDADRSLPIHGPKQRALLALLLLHANRVVSADRLVEELWGRDRPAASPAALQQRLSQLRKALGKRAKDVLLTQPPGYVLRAELDSIDSQRFERLLVEATEASGAGDTSRAAKTLREALALWRGPALADFLYEPFAQSAIARLEELRLVALEERIEADLALGRHAALAGELEALVREHPLRERLRGQLMLALYRSGRQADALAAYQETRRTLVEQLGIDPSTSLQRLEKAILQQEPALELRIEAPALPVAPEVPEAPPPVKVPAAAREMRKTVTVLVSQIPASTREGLDPELSRRLLDRCFETALPALERHGALVERSNGAGIRAFFGIPIVHEDDALRALRAAVEVREALDRAGAELERDYGLRVAARTGIETGEILAEEPRSGRLLFAEQPIVAATQLAQEAGPGEILVGAATRRLVLNAVRVEQVTAAGEADAVSAWRLIELIPDAPAFARRFEGPLVGRGSELAQLRQAFDRAVRDRTPYLFTVFGFAGFGKTRLGAELAAALGTEATVLTGRCLSYGEGITFWPLREMIGQAAGEVSHERLLALLRGEHDAELVADRIAGALGLVEVVDAGEETFWAVRRLFEAMARTRPLLVVFDDVHWAEPTFLDLVEHLADRARDAPMLLLCLARPELLEERRTWAGGKLNATSIHLEPLDAAESDALIDNLTPKLALPSETRARVKERAEGNPLFLEQMLALLAEEGRAGELGVPPTIQALLAARLDRLGPGERAVIERAAVVGREFWQGAVADLLPEEARSTADRHVDALVRKELLRPDRSSFPGEETFRFRHALIQEATYRAIPKKLRGELHERFADWLEGKAGARSTEYEELLGYHLEQAFRYRAELAPFDEHRRDLARRAAERLASGGRRAYRHGDVPAAVNLLERAVSLLPDGDRAEVELLPDLAFALFLAGETGRADAVLARTVEVARGLEDQRVEWRAIVHRTHWQTYGEQRELEDARREAEQAIAVLGELADDLGLARAWVLLSDILSITGQMGRGVEAAERGVEHARRAGSHREVAFSVEILDWALLYGPSPAPEGLRRCEELLEAVHGNLGAEAGLLSVIATFHAMLGEFTRARELIERSMSMALDLGLQWETGWRRIQVADIELLAGDPAAAERQLLPAYDSADRSGDKWLFRRAAVELARAVYEQGRHKQALELNDSVEEGAGTYEVEWQVKQRGLRAKVLARRGELEDAIRLGQEAVRLAEQTDCLNLHGDALLDLSEVLSVARRAVEAASTLEQAVRLYVQKGNVVAAGRAEALAEELRRSI